MGIKKGNTLINKYAKEISLETLRNKIVIVDLFYLLHKFIRLDISNPLYYSLEVINFIEKFKYYGIIPIFVIDGRPLLEKSNKLKRTREKTTIKLNKLVETESINNIDKKTSDSLINKSKCVKKEYIDTCKDLFTRLDCLYIHVFQCEGDSVIAELVSLLRKDINTDVFVYSADFDMFLYRSINTILKDLDFEKNTFKLYIKEDILNQLNITQYELILAGFLTGTDYNCGLYKATMETSIELIKIYGPFKSLEQFLNYVPIINNDRVENQKLLVPTYNFIERYELVLNIFNLTNTSTSTKTFILKFINEKIKKINHNIHKNTLSNFFNVKYVLDYIQSITQDSYIIQKYREKVKQYSKLHFGFNITYDTENESETIMSSVYETVYVYESVYESEYIL
jgi:hypothetical protein